METETHQAAPQVSDNGAVRSGRRAQVYALFRRPLLLAAVNMCLGAASYSAAWLLRTFVAIPYTQTLLPQERWSTVDHPWIALAVSQLVYPYIFGLFEDLRRTRFREIVSFAFLACALQVFTVSAIYFLTSQIFPRTLILIFGCVNFLLICAWHFYLKRAAARLVRRVLVVSEEPCSSADIIRDIERSPWMGMVIVGLVFHRNAGRAKLAYPVLGTIDDVREIVDTHRIDEIVFASETSWKDRFLNSLSQLQEATPVRVAIIPSPFEMAIGKLRHVNIHDTPLIEVKRTPNEPLERLLKRSCDALLSALCLLAALPVGLVIGVLIKLSSPGPVFYLQNRVGYGGRVFRLLKFRTMIDNAESECGVTLASPNDPRVTGIGRFLRRFRMDELPQLVNVLRGDMSFVGPRPERPEFVESFLQDVPGYNERHKVKPGITGLAQVRSSYDTTAENKLKYDLAYIYNYTFSLDILILLQTIRVVLFGRGS
jgi:exopolysaccharide biosynthesis polyprenyl glycosylphosphotransferase